MKPTRDDPTIDDPDASEALEGLDALADLAIQEEGESLASSSQATTKHPRHRPGCTCIVCIQPPSGKGTKHKETCTCNVCLTVKRRFRTLMLRREKRQSEKEAESARQKQQVQFSEQLPDDGTQLSNDVENGSPYHKIAGDEDPEGDLNQRSSSLSPFKGQFDLNIQPERDEEQSPGSDSSAFLRLIQEATDKCLLAQQTLSCLTANQSSGGNQTHLEGVGEGNLSNGIALGSAHQDTEAVRPVTLSMTELALTSPTDE